MYGRLYVCALALGASALGGCVQTTRHSNTMLFGTNTQFGIRAGASASSVPEINIGYTRQEAVIMPLIANILDNGKYQSPCDVSQAVDAGDAEFLVHPCLFVGVNGTAQDSYSVLASFGAKFDGGASASGAQAKGGLAQYFATGMAAQILALNGGASVVATGEAAEKASEEKPSPEAVSALFGDKATVARGVSQRTDYYQFKSRLLEKIDKTKVEELAGKVGEFEKNNGAADRHLAAACASTETCKKAVVDKDPYRNIYSDPDKRKKLNSALDAWKTE